MPSSASTRVTASDIAEAAGVSTATVSLVLNRRGDDLRIRPATQQRVLEAAERLNYRPNSLARGLTGASTKTLGLLWPIGGAPGNAGIAYRLIERFARRGYLTFLTDNLSSTGFTRRALEDLAERRIDGLILCGEGRSLQDPGVLATVGRFDHAVMIGARPVDGPADFILHDRGPAMREIAAHFAATGRRRAAVLTVGEGNPLKIAAFTDELECRGIAPAPGHPLTAPFHEGCDAGTEAIRLLEEHYRDRPFDLDAVACTDDTIAVALLAWLRGRGRRVPEDVAVAGFNDEPTGRHLATPLASVDRRDAEVAELAERLLFDRLEGEAPDTPARHEIGMRFLWRESAGNSSPATRHR